MSTEITELLKTKPELIKKRNGQTVPFDTTHIENAIKKCFIALEKEPNVSIEELAKRTINLVVAKRNGNTFTVEEVQNIVEMVLQSAGEFEAAKAYILYRAQHEKLREEKPIPFDVKQAYDESAKYFPTSLQQTIFYLNYSRFDYEKGRRETWQESIDRAVNFLRELSENKLEDRIYEKIKEFILEMRVIPSLRLLATAGKAARRQNLSCYNCSYLPIKDFQSFVEVMLLSMAGTGVGYSVELQYVEQLPRIKRQKKNKEVKTHVVEDSTEGWGEALKIGLETWFEGENVEFDYSLIRPAGSPLKIKGGRASGKGPLEEALSFIKNRILARQGLFLRPIDAHDIVCKTAGAVLAGGHRRSALIALFDWSDLEMRNCKNIDLIATNNKQRWNANNSAVWNEEVGFIDFTKHMTEMFEGGAGEPGIFSRNNANSNRPRHRKRAEFGTNPCSEISLRPYELCNLSAVVARHNDTLETLLEKVEIATIIGTIQSMATYFPGMRSQFKENCEEERLLGVDITGQMDCAVVRDIEVKQQLRKKTVEINKLYAEKLGIKPSASITCVKPSGNSSQLLDCASGLHPRWSKYYVRNVRISVHSPLFKAFQDEGVPMDPDNGESTSTWVIHFPVKSPEGSITKDQLSAIDQCQNWLDNKVYWTDHNPSVTIHYQQEEMMELMKWVWDHKNQIGGMSFFPKVNMYGQLPYVEITEEEYEHLASKFPTIDFSKIYRYEDTDLTEGAQQLACSSGICEL